MKKYKKLILIAFALFAIGCSGPNDNSKDPIERAGSYIAGAIITSAVIRAFFND